MSDKEGRSDPAAEPRDPIDAGETSRIIGLIYDCAIDPALWPQTLAEIGGFLRGNRPRIFLFDSRAEPTGASFGVDRDFNRAFDSDSETLASIRYGFVVADLDVAMTLDEILGTRGGRDVNGRLPYDNRFYREWMEPRGAHDALAALLVKTPRRFGGVALTRTTPNEPFGAAEKEKVRLLGPHIRRALAISDMVGERTVERDRFAEIIGALATPVAIAEPDGRVLHANDAARKLVAGRGAVSTEHERLRAADPLAREQLRAALQNEGHSATTLTLPEPDGEGGLVASVLPLGARTGRAGPSAIFFHARESAVTLPGEAFARLHGLTGAELRVLTLLVEGDSVQQIAARSGSSPETVRWHVKNLLLKTGCARQSDLVRMATLTASPMAQP